MTAILDFIISIWNAIFGGGVKPKTGVRSFFTCQFLLKGQWPVDNTMQFFANNVDDTQRQKYLDQVISLGLDSIFVFMLNADRNGIVTFYKDKNMTGGEIDQNEITLRKTWLAKMVKMGIQPILCMQCCERDLNQTWSSFFVNHPGTICSAIMPQLEQYNPLWVSFLEAEKNVDGAGAQKVCNAMCLYTMSPIGIHSSKLEYITGAVGSKQIKFIKAACGKNPGDIVQVDDFLAWEQVRAGNAENIRVVQSGYNWIAYERGEDPSRWDSISPEQEHADCGRIASNVRSPKRFALFEYSLGRINDKHEKQGLAAAFYDTSKTFGVGSGCPEGLGDFMRQLPAGMNSSRNGNIVTLTGAGITATANLATGEFKRM